HVVLFLQRRRARTHGYRLRLQQSRRLLARLCSPGRQRDGALAPVGERGGVQGRQQGVVSAQAHRRNWLQSVGVQQPLALLGWQPRPFRRRLQRVHLAVARRLGLIVRVLEGRPERRRELRDQRGQRVG